MHTGHLREKGGQTRPAVEEEFVEVFNEVNHDVADLSLNT